MGLESSRHPRALTCRRARGQSRTLGGNVNRRSMGLLTADMKRVGEEQHLGFVATVCPDGTPNLSPKGTPAVWDDDHLVSPTSGHRAPSRISDRTPVWKSTSLIHCSARAIASRASPPFSNPERSTTRRSRSTRSEGPLVSAIREVVLVRVQR